MMSDSKEVSVTVSDGGQVTSIAFSDEPTPRDLSKPNGQLEAGPMSLRGCDEMIGFQTVTVFAVRNADGTKRLCVKLMNCSYFCA